MDWRERWRQLLRNKPLLYGLGAAAALGAFVLYQRTRAGETGPASTDDEASGGGIGQPGYLNTTGTDVANWLGQYSESLQNQFDEFRTSIEEQLGKIPTEPTPSPPKPVTTQPVQVVPPKPKPKTPVYVTVAKYTKSNTAWNSTLSGIAKHYKTSVDALRKLNPSIKNPNVIYTGQKIRVS